MAFDAWRYDEPGGGITRMSFDSAGRIDDLECSSQSAAADSCPGVLGLGIGSNELAVYDRLGRPNQERYAGDAKVMSYDGLGLSFTLRRLVVVRIGLSRHDGFMTYLGRGFRSLVP